jgi:hypothetical protein
MPRVVGLALGFGLAELAAKKNDEGVCALAFVTRY